MANIKYHSGANCGKQIQIQTFFFLHESLEYELIIYMSLWNIHEPEIKFTKKYNFFVEMNKRNKHKFERKGRCTPPLQGKVWLYMKNVHFTWVLVAFQHPSYWEQWWQASWQTHSNKNCQLSFGCATNYIMLITLSS